MSGLYKIVIGHTSRYLIEAKDEETAIDAAYKMFDEEDPYLYNPEVISVETLVPPKKPKSRRTRRWQTRKPESQTTGWGS